MNPRRAVLIGTSKSSILMILCVSQHQGLAGAAAVSMWSSGFESYAYREKRWNKKSKVVYQREKQSERRGWELGRKKPESVGSLPCSSSREQAVISARPFPSAESGSKGRAGGLSCTCLRREPSAQERPAFSSDQGPGWPRIVKLKA